VTWLKHVFFKTTCLHFIHSDDISQNERCLAFRNLMPTKSGDEMFTFSH